MSEGVVERVSLATRVSTILSLSIVVSVSYEWTFYTVMGVSFFNLISPQDYVRLLLQWAPFFIFFAGAGALTSMILRRVEKGQSEAQLSEHPKYGKFVRGVYRQRV